MKVKSCSQLDNSNSSFEEVVDEMEIHEYLMSIFTWNLSGNLPGEDIDFAKLLKREIISEAPDIAIFGFQEVIELGIVNVFSDLDSKALKEFSNNILGGRNF